MREVSSTSLISVASRPVSLAISSRNDSRWSGVSSRQRCCSVRAEPITAAIGRAQLVRDERDEVGAQRREPPQLLDGLALGLVGADVLHGARRRAGRAGQPARSPPRVNDVRLASGRARASRSSAPPAAAARRAGSAGRARGTPPPPGYRPLDVAPVDRLVRAQQLLQQRSVDRAAPSRAASTSSAPAPAAAITWALRLLAEHDRDPVEREQAAHLADERVEGLLELERRAERPGAAVGGLERSARRPSWSRSRSASPPASSATSRLADQAAHEPADDQAHQHLDPELEGDVVDVVAAADALCRSRSHSKVASTGALAARAGRAPPTIP